MIDKRVTYARTVLDGLLESLDAAVRIARWPENEGVPPALQLSADQLAERLGNANRVLADKFVGAPTVTKIMQEMSTAIALLDAAYLEYRGAMAGTDAERQEGVSTLEAGLVKVRDNPRLWS
jgi:hypothetical protein